MTSAGHHTEGTIMKTRDTGIIYLGHPDYLDENAANIRQAADVAFGAVSGITARGNDYVVTNEEAAAAAKELAADNYCGAVLVLGTWVECNIVMTVVKELRGLPCVMVGFPLTEVKGRKESTGSYVSATMFAGVVRRLGLPIDVLFGSFSDPVLLKKLAAFASAAKAASVLRYAKIGLFGYTSMSIYTGTFDHVLMRWHIGPEIEQMDSWSLIERAKAVTEEEVIAAEERLRGTVPVSEKILPEMLNKTLAIYAALSSMTKEKGWDAVNVKCQYEFSKEYKCVPCVPLSMLADDGVVTSCEGDIPCTVSMLMLRALTGQTVTYGDALNAWENIVEFSPCGFMPFSVAAPGCEVWNFLPHPGFTGIQVAGVMRPEKVTFLRLVEDIGSYHLVCGTGQGLPTKMRGGCMPALDVALDGSLSNLENAYAGQHFALCYGDHAQEAESLAHLLGIRFVRV